MIWPTLHEIESWGDHFRDLGYPSKFYRGHDTGFDSGSSHDFSQECYFSQKKKPPAGLHQTEDRAGDAPKPPFPSKSIENQ